MDLLIILGDKNPDLIDAWTQHFQGLENVEVRGGNILFAKCDALVSPANSFGFMDGGLDWSISELMEWKIQAKVQEVIHSKHAGELLVGDAEIVATGNTQFPYLVCAPTMRVPQPVADSLNAFLAMRAILLAISKFNTAHGAPIKSVAIPGLATGIGKMPYDRCAKQMRAAFDQVVNHNSNHYQTLSQAIDFEKELKA